MALAKNVMEFFKPAPPANTDVKPNQPAPAKQPTVDPNNPAPNLNSPETIKNPLDVYAKLFDTANKSKETAPPSFRLPSDKIKEVATSLDFTKGINPELMAKANTGDTTAILELMQQVSRNSYTASLEHLTALTDQHLTDRSVYDNSRINTGVKNQLIDSSLSTIPNASHPVVKRELSRIAGELAKSPEFADATPEAIAKAAQEYFQTVFSSVNPADPTKDTNGKTKPAETDWDNYFGVSKS